MGLTATHLSAKQPTPCLHTDLQLLSCLQANIGLDHVWAVVNNNASYGALGC